jgi:hypothetical protein
VPAVTRSWRLLLLSLFALLLLGQSVAAPAHCLRQARPVGAAESWARLGIAMPLCTPEGLAAAADDASRPAPQPHGEPGFCLVCPVLPPAVPPQPPPLPQPRWQRLAEAPPPAAFAPPPRPAIGALPSLPRGPPGAG